MDASSLFLLSSGLFLGWSLGANDAANVFGTAVESRMVRFRTAALLCSVFVVLGAVLAGQGAAHGLNEVGTINALAGAFTVALAAALTVGGMTRLGLPVSTTQAIVGALVGHNLFSGAVTDRGELAQVVGSWVAAPVLGALFTLPLYALLRGAIRSGRVHVLRQDQLLRWGLVLAGVLGSYALGANNIGNVMGVFLSSNPFTRVEVGDVLAISATQQLFALGALAVAAGVATYSRRVMTTVGRSILPLTPAASLAVVLAHSIVLLLFSSRELAAFLRAQDLPTLPLIPVSSSQAIVGGVLGVAALRGRRGLSAVRWRRVAGIASGWVATPLVGALVCTVALFVVQNVFDLRVYEPRTFALAQPVLGHLGREGLETRSLRRLVGTETRSGTQLVYTLRERAGLDRSTAERVAEAARVLDLEVTAKALRGVEREHLEDERWQALRGLRGQTYRYAWQLRDALAAASPAWQRLSDPEGEQVEEAERREAAWRHVLERLQAP